MRMCRPPVCLALSAALVAFGAWPRAHVARAAVAPVAKAAVASGDAAAAQAAVKALVGAIRYNKDALALKRLDVRGMCQCLMGPQYKDLTAADKAHLEDGFGKLLTGVAFVRGRAMFHYLDALLFTAPSRQGDSLHLPSTIVVHRELKKVEVPVEWVLSQSGGAWRVVDIVAQNESTCAGIREEEVAPLIKEGGIDNMLRALDARVADVARAGRGKAN